jgi:WD40 repeat protein
MRSTRADHRDGTVQLWDTATRQPAGDPLTHPEGVVIAVAFSSDGTLLATIRRNDDEEARVRLWTTMFGS